MDHVTLNGAGPHNGDLDDEIIELTRAQAWQHVHLGAAFHLKHAERISLAQHVVHGFVFARQIGQRQLLAAIKLRLVLVNEVESLADAGEHAERQHIDLHQPHLVDIVLVPFDERSLVHRCRADRHGLVQSVTGQNETADMLRQVARKADQRDGQFHRASDDGIVGVETRLSDMLLVDAAARYAPDRIGERCRHILSQPQRLADIADRTAGPIADDGCDNGRAISGIALIDILHHLFAPLMLEIDVDIRRFLSLHRKKALEQEIDLCRVHTGDAKAEADDGIGGRTTPLTQNIFSAGIAHNVINREKVSRILQLFDQRQFLVDQRLHLRRDAVSAVMTSGTFPGEIMQMLLRRLAGRHRLVGIIIFQLIKLEGDGRDEIGGSLDCFSVVAEQPQHFLWWFQVAFGVLFEKLPGCENSRVVAGCRQHILKRAAVGMMIEHVIGGEQRHIGFGCKTGDAFGPASVMALMRHGERQPDRAGGSLRNLGQARGKIRSVVFRRKDRDLELSGAKQQVAPFEMAFALDGGACLALRQQAAQLPIGRTITRIDDHIRRAVGEGQATADEKPEIALVAKILPCRMCPHHTGQRVAVGNADTGQTKLMRTRYQFLRMRRTAQEGEIAGSSHFEIRSHHANSPCKNQRG